MASRLKTQIRLNKVHARLSKKVTFSKNLIHKKYMQITLKMNEISKYKIDSWMKYLYETYGIIRRINNGFKNH